MYDRPYGVKHAEYVKVFLNLCSYIQDFLQPFLFMLSYAVHVAIVIYDSYINIDENPIKNVLW